MIDILRSHFSSRGNLRQHIEYYNVNNINPIGRSFRDDGSQAVDIVVEYTDIINDPTVCLAISGYNSIVIESVQSLITLLFDRRTSIIWSYNTEILLS